MVRGAYVKDRSSDGLNIEHRRVLGPIRAGTCASRGLSRAVFSYAIRRGDLILIYIKRRFTLIMGVAQVLVMIMVMIGCLPFEDSSVL